MASLSTRPTGSGQYAWGYSETFKRTTFLQEIEDEMDDTEEIITSTAAGILWDFVSSCILGSLSVYATVIITTATLMNALTSKQRKAMMQKIFDQFTDEDNTYTKCKVYLKFRSYQKGSQGWFWYPTSTYELHYS